MLSSTCHPPALSTQEGSRMGKCALWSCLSLLMNHRQEIKACGGPSADHSLLPPPSPAHLCSPGDDPRVVAHSLKGTAQRHGACLPGTETSSKHGDDASHSSHPASFPPNSLPNLLSAILPGPCGASLHYLTVMRKMTCPSSCRKAGWPRDPHRKFCFPLATFLVKSSDNTAMITY